jgi:hypothetical protein
MMSRGEKIFLAWGLFLGLLLPNISLGATRTVYVDGFTNASSTNGYTANANAKCIILLNNPSPSQQSVTLTMYVYATNVGSGNATAVTSNPSATIWTNPIGGAGVNPFTATNVLLDTVSPNNKVKYEFTYPAFPSSITGQQVLICRGTIVATDSSAAAPGFVVASGTFLTFSEASAMQTSGVTSASTSFQGNAVFSQMPITINRGRPF